MCNVCLSLISMSLYVHYMSLEGGANNHLSRSLWDDAQ